MVFEKKIDKIFVRSIVKIVSVINTLMNKRSAIQQGGLTMDKDQKTALIVVDVQSTFMEGGGLPVPQGEDVVSIINDLMNEFDYVITTQDWHINPGEHISNEPDFVDSWPVHGMANTQEAELHPNLNHPLDGLRIKKGQYDAGYSGFSGVAEDGRNLEKVLLDLGVKKVFVCGLATEYCVRATALDSRDCGFDTTVILRASRGVTPEGVENAVSEMRDAEVEIG